MNSDAARQVTFFWPKRSLRPLFAACGIAALGAMLAIGTQNVLLDVLGWTLFN